MMKIYKRLKFPIELTMGRAEDLYRLRFMRRSELEPLLLHTMRNNSHEMGRQLDLWCKEKSLTIGSLNKEQDKVYKSQLRLKKEVRRIKRDDYVRQQNEIREKLKALRYRMTAMKVLRKFRENVDRKKRERERGTNKKLEVANYVLSVPTQTDYPEHSDILKKPVKDTKLSRAHVEPPTVLDRDTTIRAIQVGNLPQTVGTKPSTAHPKTSRSAVQRHCATDSPSNLNSLPGRDNNEENVLTSIQSRYPSSKGPRMETILEENPVDNALELEIEDTVDRKLTLASERLRPLNRSQSNRNIFDTKEQVPLLPEVAQRVTSLQTGTKEDKGTQTVSKHWQRKPAVGDKAEGHTTRKKLVVKLPSPVLSPTSAQTTHSSSSTFGQFGSDTDGGYPESSSDTDEGFYFDSDTVEPSQGNSELLDSLSSDDTLKERDAGLTITFNKYKQALKRKQENSAFSNFIQHHHNMSVGDIPLRAVFPKQNPFSLRFKERSFYLNSRFDESRNSSARSSRRNQNGFQGNLDNFDDKRDKQFAKSSNNMASTETLRKTVNKSASIAVFGVKANSQKVSVVPPNTPQVQGKKGFGQRSQTHPGVALQLDMVTHRTAQWHDRQRPQELRNKELIDSRDQGKNSELSPYVSPRTGEHTAPTMKNMYYRDKLLKAERDRILNQNMRMKRFIDTFENVPECSYAGINTRPSRAVGSTSPKSSPRPKKTLSSFIFEVQSKGTGDNANTKIATPTSVSPQRMLKDCRYLRQYRSVTEKDYIATFQERRTSWQKKTESLSNYDNYVANVRLQLS